MNDETRCFFDARGLQEHKLKERRPRGVDANQIPPAMEAVYQKVLEGEIINPLMLARKVWAVAREMKPEAIPASTINQYKEKINEYKVAANALHDDAAKHIATIRKYRNGLVGLGAGKAVVLVLYVLEVTGLFKVSDFMAYLMGVK